MDYQRRSFRSSQKKTGSTLRKAAVNSTSQHTARNDRFNGFITPRNTGWLFDHAPEYSCPTPEKRSLPEKQKWRSQPKKKRQPRFQGQPIKKWLNRIKIRSTSTLSPIMLRWQWLYLLIYTFPCLIPASILRRKWRKMFPLSFPKITLFQLKKKKKNKWSQ